MDGTISRMSHDTPLTGGRRPGACLDHSQFDMLPACHAIVPSLSLLGLMGSVTYGFFFSCREKGWEDPQLVGKGRSTADNQPLTAGSSINSSLHLRAARNASSTKRPPSSRLPVRGNELRGRREVDHKLKHRPLSNMAAASLPSLPSLQKRIKSLPRQQQNSSLCVPLKMPEQLITCKSARQPLS
ncbi:hypothetical protein BaRGS_00007104 [Batillaria attramentaria]|uniref:Uncharacterized protein n=1 Tax=Batillaria attramentaria TaxID=370345 RepID=A0ABD0LRA9_9CAEN